MILNLILEGNVISKKNSRINTASGRSFPSKKYSDWEEDAIKQVGIQTKARFYKPVSIAAIIYFPTEIKSDLDNRLTSLLDMLVKSMVLRDDKWQDVPKISAAAEYRKGKGGASIRIEEL